MVVAPTRAKHIMALADAAARLYPDTQSPAGSPRRRDGGAALRQNLAAQGTVRVLPRSKSPPPTTAPAASAAPPFTDSFAFEHNDDVAV